MSGTLVRASAIKALEKISKGQKRKRQRTIESKESASKEATEAPSSPVAPNVAIELKRKRNRESSNNYRQKQKRRFNELCEFKRTAEAKLEECHRTIDRLQKELSAAQQRQAPTLAVARSPVSWSFLRALLLTHAVCVQ